MDLYVPVALLNPGFSLPQSSPQCYSSPLQFTVSDFISMSLSLLSFSIWYLYLLLYRSCLVSPQFFFERNCSINRYRFGVSVEEVRSSTLPSWTRTRPWSILRPALQTHHQWARGFQLEKGCVLLWHIERNPSISLLKFRFLLLYPFFFFLLLNFLRKWTICAAEWFMV